MLNLAQCNSCRRTQASGWCTFWSYSRHHKTWSIWSSYSSCRSLINVFKVVRATRTHSLRQGEGNICCCNADKHMATANQEYLGRIGCCTLLNLVLCNSCRRTQASGWCTFWSYSRHHKTWSIWSSYSSCRSLINVFKVVRATRTHSLRQGEGNICCCNADKHMATANQEYLGRIGCCTLLNLVLCNSCRRTEASGCCTFWSYSRHHKT